MNIQNYDILNILLTTHYKNQRDIAKASGYSLGAVNKAVTELKDNEYLDNNLHCTEKAKQLAVKTKPRQAIILAAGIGLRMAPINLDTPKSFLEVNGEPLIERLIKQLKESGINKIFIVVGFKKEQFEYLIDKYNVELVVNRDYAIKNNLHSLKLLSKNLSNCYIMPSDIWCKVNPFNQNEFYSWYMVNDSFDENSTVRVNRTMELVVENGGNSMIGISYITDSYSSILKDKIETMCNDKANDDCFWETALYEGKKLSVVAKLVSSTDIQEINTYEQLRNLDNNSKQLHSKAINFAASKLNVSPSDIYDINALKTGMTNRSFLFKCNNKKYIMRIPGEGTDRLINRKEEADVYNIIKDKNICDNILCIDPETGYKITEYIENAKCCNPYSESEIKQCMIRLRNFHNLKLKVSHTFDLFGKIDFYESLWNGKSSLYKDYNETKLNVFSLKNYIDQNKSDFILTHIDAVPDNFLITNEGSITLIDWEYAAMQDPLVDIAMFCIYALYDRAHVDSLIDAYFTEGCPEKSRILIYCYIAVCGLLWSNWCEYKSHLGVEFGEYSLKQYRFAKDYFRIVQQELNK